MSYQVLARKWRPAKFEQMVGQSHVLMALTNALSQQRLHHAYLFTGTRGVGKTSLARLFAKGLNCETGVTANPCGKCSSCLEIAQGRFVDLIEVDAASRTKVDDTRELLDNVQYRPSRGRFKVYLIDEVHMLSRSSFNALLKTLEEPPEHVKFLLATTDPHKLPVTVLSRCLQFNLKSLSQDEISKQLEYVISQEQLPFEQKALSLLAKAANGSMRDALSLTDQAIAFGSGQVMLEQVQTMLGSIDEQHVLALLKALCDADVGPLMQTVAKVLAFGADAEEVLRSLLELLHQITLTQFAPAAAQQSLFSEQILAFAQQLAPEQVQLYYQMLLNGRKDLPFAPDPKSGLEMALLRAIAFIPEKQVKRWVTATPANIDLNVVEHSSSSVQEVVETGPKPEAHPHTDNMLTPSALSNQTADIEVAIEAEGDDVIDDEPVAASLIAEQALLLDQAHSLGYESSPSTNAVIKVDDASAHDTNDVVGNKVTASVQPVSEVNTNKPKSDAVFADVAEQHNFASNGVGSETVQAVQPDSRSFSEYSFMDYGSTDDPSMDYQSSDHDEYIAFTALNETTEANAVDTSNLILEEDEPTNKDSIDDLDDFLDEVLASRDSLIADVGALQQKEELAKNESIKTTSPRMAKAVLKPATVANESPAASNVIEPKSSSKPATEVKQSQTVVDYDRPPWVAPEEDEQVNKFADAVKPTVDQVDGLSNTVNSQYPSVNDPKMELLSTPQQNNPSAPVVCESVMINVEPHSIQGNEVDLHWYNVMTNVSVGGRVRQLGVNSVCSVLSNPIVLVLKPDQKHLSAQIAIEQLQMALSEYQGQPTQVEIQIGLVPHRETPLELRKRFHRELIAQAQQSILLDDKVKWMIQHLSAQLDSNTIEYPSEQLGQIALDIAKISAS
ncbi:DNA polymerase III subunit gamma/tau [Shewanella sp. A14]